MKRQYPFYVLFVDVPHDMVDVNVHPNKADVRFTDGRLIYGAVYSVISGVLDGTRAGGDFVVDAVRIPEIKSSYSAEQTSVFSSGEQISLSRDSQDKAYEGAAEANKAQIGVSDAQSVQNEAVNLVSEVRPCRVREVLPYRVQVRKLILLRALILSSRLKTRVLPKKFFPTSAMCTKCPMKMSPDPRLRLINSLRKIKRVQISRMSYPHMKIMPLPISLTAKRNIPYTPTIPTSAQRM